MPRSSTDTRQLPQPPASAPRHRCRPGTSRPAARRPWHPVRSWSGNTGPACGRRGCRWPVGGDVGHGRLADLYQRLGRRRANPRVAIAQGDGQFLDLAGADAAPSWRRRTAATKPTPSSWSFSPLATSEAADRFRRSGRWRSGSRCGPALAGSLVAAAASFSSASAAPVLSPPSKRADRLAILRPFFARPDRASRPVAARRRLDPPGASAGRQRGRCRASVLSASSSKCGKRFHLSSVRFGLKLPSR